MKFYRYLNTFLFLGSLNKELLGSKVDTLLKSLPHFYDKLKSEIEERDVGNKKCLILTIILAVPNGILTDSEMSIEFNNLNKDINSLITSEFKSQYLLF